VLQPKASSRGYGSSVLETDWRVQDASTICQFLVGVERCRRVSRNVPGSVKLKMKSIQIELRVYRPIVW
jgi:hypothetical protein